MKCLTGRETFIPGKPEPDGRSFLMRHRYTVGMMMLDRIPSVVLVCASAYAAFGLPEAAAQVAGENENGDVTVGATVSIVSDYRFRGWSLSDDGPAVQLDVIATHASGLYAGAFASSIDAYGGDTEGEGATVELDFYGGWAGDISGWQVDIGAQVYTYPGAHGVNYLVLPVSVTLSIDAVDLTAGFEHTPAQNALGDETSNYLWLEAAWTATTWPVTFRSSIGFEDGAMAPGGKTDWAVSASLPTGALEFAITYVDSDEAAAGSALVAEARAYF